MLSFNYRCQDVFAQQAIGPDLHSGIAISKALKENIFMMVVCFENRIPLFVIGKPGTSKSLSNTQVVKAMRGDSSKSSLFKSLKMVSIENCRRSFSYQPSKLASMPTIKT